MIIERSRNNVGPPPLRSLEEAGKLFRVAVGKRRDGVTDNIGFRAAGQINFRLPYRTSFRHRYCQARWDSRQHREKRHGYAAYIKVECHTRRIMAFYEIIEDVGKSIDGAGVAVIVIGALAATLAAGMRVRRGDPDVYRLYRQQLGRSVLLGLELLVAADIIRTVAVTPTLGGVAVLGGIVFIRTFLSFSLELEISGSWPWQKAGHARDA